MKRLPVEKELLEEYKKLLEIPQIREYMHHAKENGKILFARYMEEDPVGEVPGSVPAADTVSLFRTAPATGFHLIYRNNCWNPVIDLSLSDSGFGVEDLMPDGLIEYITGHTYAKYHWYYIERRAFNTPNHGLLEFNVQFKYINREFIAGKVEIACDDHNRIKAPALPAREKWESEEDNIIHMNKNRKQFLEILDDREACEFLHYFCTFPFYRDMILQDFRTTRPYLAAKFEQIINRIE